MTFKLSLRQKLAAIGVAGAVVLGAGGAVAWAQTGGSPTTVAPAPSSSPSLSTPSTAPASSADKSSAAGRLNLRAIARRSVHGDVTVKDKDGQFVTVTFDRGSVTAASASSITLQRPDGQSVTLTVNTDTKVHGPASAAAVATGKDAVVVSRSGTATQILQRKNA